ncbi:MAG: hypothetical protein M3P39_01175, partial [Actinomycetota bacterium]|nr:hypothetical protein [Actinomycetota bacterium]
MVRALAACVVLAALSLLLVPSAPGYDAQAWLLWGREVAGGGLDTREGPAFKPLPVAVCALLAPLGDLAPEAWLVVARAGTLLALVAALVLARRLSGGSALAGAAAAVAVALGGELLRLGAAGGTEGWA